MGLFSKKSKTKSESTSTSTTTPDVPAWLLNPAQSIAGNLGGLIGQGPAAFTPQTSALQQQAFKSAGGLGTSPYYGQAAEALGNIGDVSAGNINASSVLEGLDKYYNPFKEQVLNPVLGDYDYQSGQTRAQQAAQAAQGGAFRGSRYGIQEAQTEGELARGRAATEGGLLGQMYGQAAGMSEADAARRQAAAAANQSAAMQAALANQAAGFQRAGMLAGLGQQTGADERANLALQGDLGAQQSAQQTAAAQYPLEYQKQMTGLLAGINPGQYFGQTSTGRGTETTTQTANPGLLGGLGQIAQIASMFMPAPVPSDRRLKVGVREVGRDPRGRRWVEFAYVWAPLARRVGLIAQEVLNTDPEAVSLHPSGFLMVDYGRLS